MAFADDTTGGRVIEETFGGPIKITLAGSASVGDLLGYSSGWKQADGDNSIYAELVAGEEGVTDDVITAWRGAKISGVTGGTAGNPVYLSDTAGGYSGSSGTVTQMVGLMSDATTMFVQPEYYGSESIFIDEMELAFGTGRDVTIEWDGTNFIVTAAADDSLIEIGDSAATQKSFDVKWYGNAANGADYLYLDASANLIYTTGVDFQFKDNDMLVFGTGAGGSGDVQMRWDGTDLDVLCTADNSILKFGDGTTSFDIWFYGSVAANYLLWDASADKLTLTNGSADLGSACEADAYTVGGTAGADFNGAVTNLTAVKGIVTAAS